MNKQITPCLWFDKQAEDAAKFYVSIFKNSKMGKISYYDAAAAEASGQPKGLVMTVEFELNGQKFTGLNGGPIFKFSEAISFMVDCKDQDEVDYYWNKLVAGGEESQCGWLKDKFGLSWQIVPEVLGKYMSDPDPEKAGRAMKAMLKMKKLDVAALKKAYDGK